MLKIDELRVNKPNTTEYVSNVAEQRKLNPDHQKMDDSLFVNVLPTIPLGIALHYVIEQAYEYVGTRKFKYSLYEEHIESEIFNDQSLFDSRYFHVNKIPFSNTSHMYYEFVWVDTLYKNNKYLYLPITPGIEFLIKHKLPYLDIYDSSIPEYQRIYPSSKYLYSYLIDIPYYYILPTNDLTHPYLPNFYFSGKVFTTKQGLVYGYFDSKGLYGIKYEEYVSFLRPHGLLTPLGVPNIDQMIYDDCLTRFEYPTKGELLMVGSSLGIKTNERYDPIHTYYLYETSDNLILLLDTKDTHPYSEEFILFINSDYIYIQSNPLFNTSSMGLNQTSVSSLLIM